MDSPPFGSGLASIDWDALAEAKRRRWSEQYASDPAKAIRAVWAHGAFVRSIVSREAMHRDRAEDLAHHIALKELIGRIGPHLG